MIQGLDTKINAILLFGPQGVGKGTQGMLLNELPGYFHVSTGDMFRKLEGKTPIEKEIKKVMESGELVDDNLLFKFLDETIYNLAEKGDEKGRYFNPSSDYIVFDGVPRNNQQISPVNKRANVEQIIYLTAQNQQKLIDRIIKRGIEQNRTDDQNPEVVKNRLEIYKNKTIPILQSYSTVGEKSGQGIILEVDGFMGNPQVIHNHIKQHLHGYKG